MLDYTGKSANKLKEKTLYLLDMDGTIYNENEIFDGTSEFLEEIERRGGQYVFITNNSSKSVEDYVQKVRAMGIKAEYENFYTSGQATAMYLKENYPNQVVYCMGTKSLIKELREAGIEVVTEVDERAGVVLLGFDTENTSEKIRNTCIMLGRDVAYLATNPDLVCPVSFGYIPDCGSMSIMLKNATGKEPFFIGKPEPIMVMTMRWYGKKHDTVTLEQIHQICYVKGIITTLYEKLPGEVWTLDEILTMKNEIEDAGLHLAGIESVNVSDAIKTGSPDRDRDIENYIKTLENLGKADIHTVCYNFMPVFDWTRTELDRKREDGTTVLAYSQKQIDELEPEKMFETIKNNMNGSVMPGWEPERMEKVKELFTLYKGFDEDRLFANLKYFLEAIMPACDKYDINMAIHPDDPSWSVFGLPRIISTQENLKRMMDTVPNKHNGITFCTGSYGTNLNNDLIDTIHMLKGRIHFAHVRNLRFNDGMRDFEESAHLSSDGAFDIYKILKALHDAGFDGPIRPDHGRMMWGEKAMPGYGLYDRALGSAYLCGLWEAIEKEEK